MKTIVKLAKQLGYDKFHPQWFENNKLEPKTEMLEMVLLQKYIREEYFVDIIITSESIGYGYMLYTRYPPKNTLSNFISEAYEEALKEAVKGALKYLIMASKKEKSTETKKQVCFTPRVSVAKRKVCPHCNREFDQTEVPSGIFCCYACEHGY
jgi:hypothetical protein